MNKYQRVPIRTHIGRVTIARPILSLVVSATQVKVAINITDRQCSVSQPAAMAKLPISK